MHTKLPEPRVLYFGLTNMGIGITSILEDILVILTRQFASREEGGPHSGIWRAKITNTPAKIDFIRIIV